MNVSFGGVTALFSKLSHFMKIAHKIEINTRIRINFYFNAHINGKQINRRIW